MKKIETTYFLFIISLVSIIVSYPFRLSSQNADTLYQQALKAKDISVGIKLAKQSYGTARSKNNWDLAVKSLNLIAEYFWDEGVNDSAKFYGKQALQLAEKYGMEPLQADTWAILGLADYRDASYEKAINKYKKSALLYEKQRDQLNVAINMKNIGICQRKLSRNTEAVATFLKAIKTFETMNDSNELSSAYNSVALCFASLTNYQKALFYNKKALSIRLSLNEVPKIAQSCGNIGFVFLESNLPDSAIFYLKKSLALYQRQHSLDSSFLVLPLQNIAAAYKIKPNLVLAERYLKRSLNIAAQYNMQEDFARGSLDMSTFYVQQNRIREALTAASITESTALALKLPELLISALAAKSQIYMLKADYKNALHYEIAKQKLKDSLFSMANAKAINDLEIHYQTNLKEKDITALNLKNKLQGKYIAALITGSILLALLILLVYLSYRRKKIDNARIKTLVRELNHRTANNLGILQSVFSIQSEGGIVDNDAAISALRENEARIVSMGLIHNQLYLGDNHVKIEMAVYLKSLIKNVSNVFFGESGSTINLFSDVDHVVIDADKAVYIGLIVNELTLNAMKHAWGEDKTGEIYLSLKQEGRSKLFLTFRDNGKGVEKETAAEGLSFGMKLINILAKQLNSKLTVKNENGACFEMMISI